MKGLLGDNNVQGHVDVLLRLFQQESRRELWASLKLAALTFHDLGPEASASDLVVWQASQQRQLVLVTANRKDEGPESLETAIRTLGTPTSLPVITIANAGHVLRHRDYAERAADALLEYLFDMHKYRGGGRLWIP